MTTKIGVMLATLTGIYGCRPATGNAQDQAPAEAGGATAPDEGDAAASEDAEPASSGDAIALPGEWTLEEKAIWAQIYEDRAQYLQLMNTSCGSEVKLAFDHEAFRDRLPSVKSDRNEDWNASAMLNAVRNLCLAGATQKTAVATRISKIEFVRAPHKKHELRGDLLFIALDVEGNPRAQVDGFSDWLPTQL